MKALNRRQFVRTAALATTGLAFTDVSSLSATLVRGSSEGTAVDDIQFGYAAITWQGQDRQAIEDVAAVGFKGIQLRTSALPEFGDKPAALKELLARHRLTMVAFSSGNVRIEPEFEAEDMATHVKHARFVRDVGGKFLQLTDTRPKRPLVAEDYRRLGRLMTEIGKRTADIGIPVAYHNHMNNIGERPEEVDRVLDATDPRYVKVLLDIAHYQQGGGDPVRAVRKFADRILFLHIKDVEPVRTAGGSPVSSYRFVELGRGTVDIKGVFAALNEVRFKGWAIVELDAVPDKARTPKESAVIARTYLTQLGLTV
jgi:inosose dehydratase